MRKDALVAFAVGDLLVGVARRLRAALQGDAGVVFPQVLLARHAFDGSALLVPHRRDVEKHRRLPVALFGLVRLEQEDRRGAQHLLAGVVAMRLGYDARVLGEIA